LFCGISSLSACVPTLQVVVGSGGVPKDGVRLCVELRPLTGPLPTPR
jgi:hypothetical protein